MLPVTFENFFEQGASTIESSMKGIEKTLWGSDSPPSYVEKKDKQARLDSKYQQQYLQQPESKTKPDMFLRTPGKTIHRNRSSQFQASFGHAKDNVQGTPTTVVDDSWGNESTITDPYSILMDSSSSCSESVTRKRPLPTPSWKYASSSKDLPAPNNNRNRRSLRNMSIRIGGKKKQSKKKLGSGSLSIDEIFGYNTKQTLTKTKTYLDEDVGLDFMILDVPVSTNGFKKRSLLIVQNIDPNGLFAKTDLGVGDAILSINGTSFENQKIQRYGRINGTRGVASEKPNLFQARALLNGRGRSVTIEYQKFGETNDNVHSSKLATSHGPLQEQQPELQQDEVADQEPLLPPQSQPSSKKFASSAHSRRSSSTRVDFLGMLRTKKSSRSSNKGKSMAPKSVSDLESSSSSDDDSYRRPMDEPPRISRRLNFQSTEKKNDANHITNTGDVDKENNRNSVNNNQEQEYAVLPYVSILNNGPEEQIELLKQRVNSFNKDSPPSSEIGSSSVQSYPKPPTDSPARSAFSESKLSTGSPARSTRSESYLQDLRKSLSPTANAILADLSVGMTDFSESTLSQSDASTKDNASAQETPKTGKLIPPTSLASDGNQRELVRVNRKVFEKLQLRVEFLKKSNMELRNEVTALKRNGDTSCQKLVQAEKQLEQKDAKLEKCESQVNLLKSRLEIATIQADKRQKELLESKEKSIANNDKVISNLSKRIEGLEKANAKLIEQLQKVGTKRKEKQASLQAQFDRLKMKFSAQSTLLDNVMTSNEELTSQNEAMESELHAYSVAAAAKANADSNNNKPPLHNGAAAFATTGMLFAEGSESELENIKRDPILLAQARELSSCKERNSHLEDQVESLSKKLAEVTAKMKATQIVNTRRSSVVSQGASEPTPSLLDVTITSSDDDVVDAVSTRTHRSTGREEPDPDVNVSGINRTNTFQLEYQHTFDNRDDLDENSGQDDEENISTSQQQSADESFESVSSFVLMERILELENALQRTDLDPEESQRFLLALQSRISKLTARGYEKVANVDVEESDEP